MGMGVFGKEGERERERERERGRERERETRGGEAQGGHQRVISGGTKKKRWKS